MSTGRYLLPYIFLFLLILAGWAGVFFIQNEDLAGKTEEPQQPRLLHSSLLGAHSSYYSDDSLVYSLSYARSDYYAGGDWTATEPQLTSYDGYGGSLLLTARLLNGSSTEDFFFNGEVVLTDKIQARRMNAKQAHIKLKESSVQLQGAAGMRSDALSLTADSIRLKPMVANEQTLQAQGAPLKFSRKSLTGQANQLLYEKAQLLLQGEVVLKDEKHKSALLGHRAAIDMNVEAIDIYGDARLEQEGLHLIGDHIHSETDGKSSVQASGSPLKFDYENLSGEAERLDWTEQRISLQSGVALQDRSHNREIIADRLLIKEKTIDATGNIEMRQDNWTLVADHIQTARDATESKAEGSPLRFEYETLSGEAERLDWTNQGINLHSRVALEDESYNRKILADRLSITEKSIAAEGTIRMRQDNWTLVADHIQMMRASTGQSIRAQGKPLHIHHQNLTVNATELDYRDSTARIYGAPLRFSHKDGALLFNGEGSLLERQPDSGNILLQGSPAKLSQVGGGSPFKLQASHIRLIGEQLLLNGNVVLRGTQQEIKAEEAVYDSVTDEWRLDGKQRGRLQDGRIEIIIPQ